MAVEDKKWDLLALKRSIPAELYNSNTPLSIYYAVRSAVLIASFLAAYLYALEHIDNIILKAAVSCVYWFLQGTVFWGVFTIGHDCGHRSFSSYQWVNDLFGVVYHGFILVPYFPWKMSHNHHHKNTGNIDKDEIFYPMREADASRLSWKGMLFMRNGFLLGLGWITYLFGGFPGINYTRTYYPESVKGVKTKEDWKNLKSHSHSHFNPMDPQWANGRFLAFASVGFNIFMVVLSWYFAQIYGWAKVVACYYVPWFVFCSYLVVVTFLHHASDKTRWLDSSIWNYARGQLENTIDRTYGGLINNLSHNIGTHVVHHLFPIIPHYNLVEANKALKAFTKKNNLPHHEVVAHISGLGEFWDNAQLYSKNFVIADDVVICSLGKGAILKKGEKESDASTDDSSNKSEDEDKQAVEKKAAPTSNVRARK